MAGERLVYFGHHKCATQYIKAVVARVAFQLGLGFQTVDRPVAAPATGADGAPRHRLHLADAGYAVPTADILYFANGNTAAVAALRDLGGYRGFHVIRDPRDIVVSGYFSHLHSHPITEHNSERMGAWRRKLSQAASEEEGLLLELEYEAENFGHLRDWNYEDPDVLELRYEDLVVEPLAVFARAFAFWGLELPRFGLPALAAALLRRGPRRGSLVPPGRRLPLPLLRRIVERNSFERRSGGRAPGEEDVRHHYRKGIPGDWRSHFTPRVTAAFKDRYGDLPVALGYESSPDW